ncbi:fibronectin type III domain-containing protein [Paenibacillus sp. GCM10023252]|uniref:fibronectin type III domain-containing protein n=1 Tax=Paenibacillus sp. GCM10023252 TaxID=3252649 RepID=UPI00361859D2
MMRWKALSWGKMLTLTGAALLIGTTVAAASASAARDPWLWPFSQDSIWNMPIGANADYQSMGHFPGGGYFHTDYEYHVKTKSTDPVRNIYGVPNWTSRCSDTSNPQGTINIPDEFIVGDATTNPYSTPNNVAAFLKPDGRTLIQLEPLTRCTAGGNVFGYRWGEDLDIQGQGIGGTHWGSGLSAIGGSLRHGELTGSDPIKHALKLNVWGNYLYYNTADATKGYRWPADRSDAGAPSNYHGTNAKIEMGSLMAIHPSATEASLGLQTAAGKKIFHALQDYGAYIADDTGWDAYAFSASREAWLEFEEVYGYSFDQSSSATGESKKFFDDMMALITKLYVVDNNSSTNVGGGGTRRAALADSTFSAMDSTAPSTPSGLTVTNRSTSSVSLSWTPASDNVRVMEYEIYNGSTYVGSTYGKTSYTVWNLTPNTSYSFKIRAKDTNTNLSSFTSVVSTSTIDGFSENFDDGAAQNWTLGTGASVEYGRLKLSNWGGTSNAIYTGASYSGSYTLKAALQTDAGDNNGKTRIYFNYTDANNTYYVQFGGGNSNTVELKKVVGGTTTTLATYSGSYSIKDWDWPTIEITAGSGTITVKGSRGGTSTTLFSGISDSSLTSGRIGLSAEYTQSYAENIEVLVGSAGTGSGGTITPYAENFDDGAAQNWTLGTGAAVEYQRLKLTNWGGASDGIYGGATYTSGYTLKAALQTDAGDNNGKTRVYFHYTDASNTYYVQFGGGTTNTVELKKVVGGTTTTLATYSGSYTIKNWDWPVIEIITGSGSITVKGNRGGTVTTLFNTISDSSLTSGKVGVGAHYTQSFVDNVSVN